MSSNDPLAKMRQLEAEFTLSGMAVIPMSEAGRPKERSRYYRAKDINGYAICSIDLALDNHSKWRVIEVNGSNGGLSSLGDPHGDRRRAEHQMEAAFSRLAQQDRGAILVAYSADSIILTEIIARAHMIRDHVGHTSDCQIGDADLEADAPFVVVVDTVERIAEQVTLRDGELYYRNRPVASVGNTNLLPALVRSGVLKRDGNGYGLADLTVFHDGPFAPIIHDKGAQQDIAAGTGLEPVRWQNCWSADDVVRAVRSFGERGLASVIKPNATSGGTGIEFFGPSSDEADIRGTLCRLLRAVRAKYGAGAAKSLWPIRVFEFVQSTSYPVAGAGHLWDLRVTCLISPGEVEMTLTGLRICPEPFRHGEYTRATTCSNTTGRVPSLERLYSPLADAGAPTAVLAAAGVDAERFEQMLDGCASWCEAAWHFATDKGGGNPRQHEQTSSTKSELAA